MKERGILFSKPMVLALLDGSKTQTRRIVKLPHMNPLGKWEPSTFGGPDGGRTRDGKTVPLQGCIWHTRTGDNIGSPHGQPGDRLWVRETHAYVGPGSGSDLPSYREERARVENHKPANCWYRADGEQSIVWTPAIHMFRGNSRITLEIVSVRVERLQDISEADALAEGCRVPPGLGMTARGDYARLWLDINGPGSWEANPWVWCLSFKRIEATS